MQIITDEQMVKTRARIGNYFFILGFVLIGVSLFLTWFRQEQVLLAFAALLLGFLLTNFGTYNMGKWGRVANTPHRADQLLEKELKGLDNRYRLYNYTLPVEHALLTPAGLVVLETRRQEGNIRCQGDRWQYKRSLTSWLRLFVEESLGNPTRDAVNSTAAMRRLIARSVMVPGEDSTESIPVDPVIVLLNPNARLTVDQPAVPVTTAKDLKKVIRNLVGKNKLPAEVYDQLVQTLDKATTAQR
jgi:hypothetical protein